jgi:hypothetical protein
MQRFKQQDVELFEVLRRTVSVLPRGSASLFALTVAIPFVFILFICFDSNSNQQSADSTARRIGMDDSNNEGVSESRWSSRKRYGSALGSCHELCVGLSLFSLGSDFFVFFSLKSDENKNHIRSLGGIELVVRALRVFPFHTEIQDNSTAALWGISMNRNAQRFLSCYLFYCFLIFVHRSQQRNCCKGRWS